MESAAQSPAQLISYHEASPIILAQALTAAQQELHARFPLADTLAWQQAFERCQPELWLLEQGPRVDHSSLIRVVTSLHTGQLTDEEADPPRYSHRTFHVARKLVRYGKWAAGVLAQHSDLTTSEAQTDIRHLLSRLEAGDGVAEQISKAFQRPSAPHLANSSPPQPPSTMLQGKVVAASLEPATLVARWTHMQHWVAQQDNPLRPWNKASIARQTQLPQRTVRVLLETSPVDEDTAALFTIRRLRSLQRLFQLFGYKPQEGFAEKEQS